MILIVLGVFLFLIILGFAVPGRTGKTEGAAEPERTGENGCEKWSPELTINFMNKQDTGFMKGFAIIMIMLSHIAIKLGDSLVIGGYNQCCCTPNVGKLGSSGSSLVFLPFRLWQLLFSEEEHFYLCFMEE